ncbi:MAG TPA: ATP-binding protein [Nitrospira sp.]|nr:ATP-binding protein [Nitrospira sp.]
MKSKFAFEIIDGFRRTAGSNKSSISAGNKQLLQELVGRATDNKLSHVLEACQKRLEALLEDRNRIGRVLHDDVLRPLLAITSRLASRRQTGLNLPSETPCPEDRSIEHLNKLISEIRKVIRDLEEGEVQEFDLMSEMHSMINSYRLVGRLDIEMIIQAHVLNLLTKEEKHEVLNITREALSNCAHHAQATRAIIKLNHSRARIRLIIMDNGIGFVPAKTESRGYGLPNIKTRVRKLGGRLQVRSQKGRGTRIVAEFTLEPILAPT